MIPPWLLAKFGPSLTRLGIYAAVASAIWLHGCDYGGDREVGKREALEKAYAVATAQAAGREAERNRQWVNAVTIAGEKYDERIRLGDTWLDSERRATLKLRDNLARSDRVRGPAEATGVCPEVSGRAKAELLGIREAVVELAGSANRDRLGLVACVEGRPR